MSFLQFRWIDFVDIVVVAILMYQFYRLVRGTVAINIIIGLFGFLILWLVIKSLKMDLSAGILDNLVNVGGLALIIVFQQEIRRFFLRFGTKYKLFHNDAGQKISHYIEPLVRACESMSKTNTGAIIVIGRQALMQDYIETGDLLNADVTQRLVESLFFKNSPLHDGAIIIVNSKIVAAGCILPVSQTGDLPKSLGLRHRAAFGLTEHTDAVVIVVSEESGEISYFHKGQFRPNLKPIELEIMLQTA
jgi:uncharacterized protein (TIGR00159 family)